MQRFSEELASSMSRMTNLTILKLSECSLTAANMKHIASSFDCTSNLTVLDINVHGLLFTTCRNQLRCLKYLKNLTLNGFIFNDQDVKYLAKLLGIMDKLVNCVLIHFDGLLVKLEKRDVERYEHWHETCITLEKCSLTATELADILKAITTRNDLIHLDHSYNDVLGGCANIGAPDLKPMNILHID